MSLDGTVCLCLVHKLESNVRLLSFRGWIQDMSGDTSSCLGEWITFASALGLAKFLGHQFRGVPVRSVFLSPLRTEVSCDRPVTSPCGGPVIFLCPFGYRKRAQSHTGCIGSLGSMPQSTPSSFVLLSRARQNLSMLGMRRKEPLGMAREP